MHKLIKYIITFTMFIVLTSFFWMNIGSPRDNTHVSDVSSEISREKDEAKVSQKQKEAPHENEKLVLNEAVSSERTRGTSARVRRTFDLPTVTEPNRRVTQEIFKGHVTVINTWASWCSACRKEHDQLMSLSKEPGVYWVGLNLNDKLEEAQWMLNLYGNPYHETIFDQKGQLTGDYGLRGTPELLILDKEGRIQHRRVGMINESIWRLELLPIIKSLQ